MFRVIGEALWSPVKHYQVTLLLLVLWFLIDFLLKQNLTSYQVYIPHPDVKVVYIIWAVCAYLGLLIASVIVNLHRKVILGNSQGLIRFIPTSVELTYALYCIAMLLILYLLAMVIGLSWAYVKINLVNIAGRYSWIEEVLLWGIFAIPVIVVLQFLIRVYLTFPRVAIEQSTQEWSSRVRKETSLISGNSFAIVFVIAFSVCLSGAFELMRRDISFKNILSNVELMIFDGFVLFFGVCTSIMVATVLSVVYRETVLPEHPLSEKAEG